MTIHVLTRAVKVKRIPRRAGAGMRIRVMIVAASLDAGAFLRHAHPSRGRCIAGSDGGVRRDRSRLIKAKTKMSAERHAKGGS
jgi:hypothetical protein